MMLGSFVLAVPTLVAVPNLVAGAFRLVAVPNLVVVVAHHPVVVPILAVGAYLHLAWRHNSGKIWFQD